MAKPENPTPNNPYGLSSGSARENRVYTRKSNGNSFNPKLQGKKKALTQLQQKYGRAV